MRRKLLALLLAAAMAITLLAACGSRQQSAARVLLNLLDGKYANVSVEIDPDLEADLRQVLSENENDDEAAIRAALEKVLGSTITFTRLGKGQQGDTTFDLVFYAGTDPDKAAQTAYTTWNTIFANVPDDGKYAAGLAMVETENGIWMLVQAAVEKAGTVDKPDKEPTPDPQPQDSKVENADGTVTYNVATVEGLKEWAATATAAYSTGGPVAHCNLLADIDLTDSGEWTPISAYSGTFDGENHSITGLTVNRASKSNGAMFAAVMSGGTVKNLTLTDVNITSTWYVGSIVGVNYGRIENCSADGEISGTVNVGGIIGYNSSESVKNCSFSGSVSGDQAVGGVVGSTLNSSITNCHSSATVTGTSSRIGGVVGDNNSNSSVIACYSTGEVKTTGNNAQAVGGVVGLNNDEVIGCYSTGSVSGNNYVGGVVGQQIATGSTIASYHAIGAVSSSNIAPQAGGVIGLSRGNVKNCYWSGDVTPTTDSSKVPSPHGLGSTTDQNHSASNVNATEVKGNDWTDAMAIMNEELSSYNWQYQPGTSGAPLTLTQN